MPRPVLRGCVGWFCLRATVLELGHRHICKVCIDYVEADDTFESW